MSSGILIRPPATRKRRDPNGALLLFGLESPPATLSTGSHPGLGGPRGHRRVEYATSRLSESNGVHRERLSAHRRRPAHSALSRPALASPALAHLVELRFFWGLGILQGLQNGTTKARACHGQPGRQLNGEALP